MSHHSGVDKVEWAVMVGFARDPADENSLDGLILQRGRGIEDDRPGVEGVYLEIPIQRHVVYGGITEAMLRKDSFSLRLNEHAAVKMAGLKEIVVRFALREEDFSDIREALREIFAGCECFREE